MKKILLSALMATAMFSAQAEDAEIEEAVKTSFSGVYFGGGIHFMTFQDYADYETEAEPADMENSTKSRLGGTILLGIGKKFESIPFYVALEAGLDFAPNADVYAKDKADTSSVKYIASNAETGLAYHVGETDYVWSQANAAVIDDALDALPAAADNTFFDQVSVNEQYSLKLRRNGLNPNIGIRLAWASDLLKSLAYVKVAAYFTKDKFRFVGHKYLHHDGVILAGTDDNYTLNGIGEGANPNPIEVKGSYEIFNSKITPEITLGIEKRLGSIGMRVEGGYLFPSGKKHGTSPEGYEFNFKKKGSCVVRLLGVWNLNLFK